MSPSQKIITDDVRIIEIKELTPPSVLLDKLEPSKATTDRIVKTRAEIHRILHSANDRLLVVIGPCSIHDPAAAVEYARRLMAVRTQYADTLEIVMRVYYEKPRTTVGWKGLINDPYLDESYRIDEGLRIARQLLIDINRLGLPAASSPRVSRRRSASRTAPMATSRSPPTRSSRPARATISCRCTRTARSRSCRPRATRTAM